MTPAIKLRPSDAHRWLVCRASPGFIAANPEKCSKQVFAYTEEGTVAHNYAAALLMELPPPEEGVTEEMRQLVSGYVDYVHGLRTPTSVLLVETAVKVFYSSGSKGYIDAVIYEPDGSAIHIVDLKYGRGVSVSEVRNAQLSIYLRSLEEQLLKEHGIEFKSDARVTLTIYQPRIQGEEVERVWETTLNDIFNLTEDIAATARWIEENPFNQDFYPADDHACQFCPIVGNCTHRAAFLLGESLDAPPVPAGLPQALETAEMALPDASSLSASQIARILLVADDLKKWLGKVEDHATSLVLKGHMTLPGHKLVSTRPHRSWTDPEQAQKLLRRMFKREDIITEKLLSPAQAMELVKARKHTRPSTVERLQELIYQPAGDPVLALATDRRPPYEVVDVAEEFEAEGAELL